MEVRDGILVKAGVGRASGAAGGRIDVAGTVDRPLVASSLQGQNFASSEMNDVASTLSRKRI